MFCGKDSWWCETPLKLLEMESWALNLQILWGPTSVSDLPCFSNNGSWTSLRGFWSVKFCKLWTSIWHLRFLLGICYSVIGISIVWSMLVLKISTDLKPRLEMFAKSTATNQNLLSDWIEAHFTWKPKQTTNICLNAYKKEGLQMS